MMNNDNCKYNDKKIEKENKQLNNKQKVIKLFWLFIIGSIFGYIIEMGYAAIYAETFELRKGLIYGPFVQIYGIGAVFFYILASKIKNSKTIFWAGLVIGGILEYSASFLQEAFLGCISWDYSAELFNFNGRTSIKYCICWGIIAVIFLKLIYPIFNKIDKIIKYKITVVISIIAIIFMSFDIGISIAAVIRKNQRDLNNEPKNVIEEFIDNKYTDKYLEKIYPNMKKT